MEETTNEVWKEVTILYSFDSRCNIVARYDVRNKRCKYYVSSLGRFKRNDKILHAKPDKVGTITYQLNKHRFKLHQIVLQTFHPEGIRNGYSPDHINRFNRLDNSLSNLRWADRQTQVHNRDNSEHQYKKVLCTNNGVVYPSCLHAEKELGLAHNTVSMGARKHVLVRGYEFKYV